MNRMSTVISEFDRYRLQRLIESWSQRVAGRSFLPEPLPLSSLQEKLLNAEIVPPGAVPANVITMNSCFRLRHLAAEADETNRLVFPEDSDPAADRLSVLAALGVAVLGHRVGDIIPWPNRQSARRFRIEELMFQPERDGRFDL